MNFIGSWIKFHSLELKYFIEGPLTSVMNNSIIA